MQIPNHMENDHKQALNEKHQFSADRPITQTDEDLLGRDGFSESLAAAIKGWQGKDSLVRALYGPWGSGKSSVKNMVLQTLRSPSQTPIRIVEINPWQWSGQNQISDGFFREIGLALGKTDPSEDSKKLAAKWAEYAARWKTGSFAASGFLKLIVVLVLVISAMGLSSLLENEWLKVFQPIIGSVALFLFALELLYGYIGTFSEKIASEFEARSKIYIQSFTDQKKELAILLRELKSPILVVIDDIDRISPEEIRLIFQLVKANADFPNLVYLLLFQRDIVEGGLNYQPAINGKEFLEKIVQLGFDIPRIERTRLEKVLFAGLDELLANEIVNKRFNKKRWQNLFVGGLQPYFQTLREVYRYLGTLSFHISLFRGAGSFEVNPVDLIALEVLRVFEQDTYQRLASAKLELTNVRGGTHEVHEQNEHTRKFIESILKDASHPDQVREIVKQIFPTVEWVFGGSTYSYDFIEEWFRELRVCHTDVFDRYFHLTILEQDVSQSELDRILSLTGNREGLVQELRSFNKRGLLGILLNRLESYKQTIDLSKSVPFITALFDIGDELPEEGGGFLSISPELHAYRIIFWHLKQEADIEKRGQILKEAMKQTNGLYLPIYTASMESSKENEQQPTDSSNVTKIDLIELQQICVKKIENAAEKEALATHPKLLIILYSWKKWEATEKSQQWVEGLTKSIPGLLLFLSACLHRSTSQGWSDHVAEEHWRINLETVEDFVHATVLESKLAQVSVENLSEKEGKAVEAFKSAVKRRQRGQPDTLWSNDNKI
ncbi:MAG: P-loop NTPase fold protein [Nitrospirales bacterium]|nr:P-loop NTPase fold protein [Nitrospirales bacterium]